MSASIERAGESPATDTARAGIDRRRFLKVAAVGAAVPVIASMCPFTGTATAAPGSATVPAPAPATAIPSVGRAGTHGIGIPRGADIAARLGRTREGRFGLLFKKLPAFAPPDDLLGELARQMTDPRAPRKDPSDGDEWDNPDVTAGYTFFGQFVDHDITRDTTPLAQQQADPRGTANYDTAALDLTSVYGGGPRRDPQLYDPNRPGYLLVDDRDGLHDLPRGSDGVARVGDPRNDENLIIAQLHAAFLHFHNALLDAGRTPAEAQRDTQWHFQWLVVHEFLPRICGREVVARLVTQGCRVPWYQPRNPLRPWMPIEFSGAAYRFGHSMVRPEYEMNDADTGPIFSHPWDDRDDLRGSRPVPSYYRADWTYFFDVPGLPRPNGLNFARRIDTRLALPLHDLPDTVVPRTQTPLFTDLAERNLLRGKQLGLPAGQDVATAMGHRPLGNDELELTDARWGGKAPLWFYVLKEAELLADGRHLGPTGGELVAGTLLTLLSLDPNSYLHSPRPWRPATVPFTVGHFLRQAGVV